MRRLGGLQHFKVSYFDIHYGYLNLNLFTSSLSLHVTTLRSLYIGQCHFRGVLDLSGFEQLEAVHLHYASFFHYKFNDAMARGLFCPRLKFLGIDFTRDWRWEWTPMDAGAETWLRDLGVYAVRLKSPLTKVFLTCKPHIENGCHYEDPMALDCYPWDRIIRLKTYFRGLGIWLGHSRVRYPTSQWLSSGSSLTDIDFYLDFIFKEY